MQKETLDEFRLNQNENEDEKEGNERKALTSHKARNGDNDNDDEEEEEEEEKGKKDKKKKKEEVPDHGGLLQIHHRYGKNYCLICTLGCFFSIANGSVMPFFSVAFRQVLKVLTPSATDPDADLEQGAIKSLWYFIVLGSAALIGTLLQYLFWGIYGSKVGVDVRKVYFDTLLKQEIAYHEKETSSGINSIITTESSAIQEGISTKLGFFFQQLATFVVGMVIAFVYSWTLSLILLACVPVLVVVGTLQGKLMLGMGSDADPFVKSGKFSQETLTNIRTVLAFPSLIMLKLADYKKIIKQVMPIEYKRQAFLGVGIGFFMFGILAVMYAVGLYAGAVLVKKGTISIGDMFGAFFAFFVGGMGLGQIGSVTGDISKGNMAANKLFELLERKPIMRKHDDGHKIISYDSDEKIEGNIEFNNITFSYPSNESTIIINQLSFTIEAGKTLAIVGPSGSGKSTIIALLERYYDPNHGDILIDGIKVHNYDPQYLRSQIGLVSQMPLLFDTSVEENIRGGLQSATKEDVVNAAKLANAHDFIMKLPQQYDTQVGEMGARLSGGQRQRIAIARAMLKKPSILLLDEATSALDSKSEREVQDALDKIASQRHQTAVVIAHRLSTITNADCILVLVNGFLVEKGNHKELLMQNGVYSTLIKSQQLIEEHKLYHQKSNERENSHYGIEQSPSHKSVKSPSNKPVKSPSNKPVKSPSNKPVKSPSNKSEKPF